MCQYHASRMENIWRNLFSDKNRCLAIMARRAALESALSGVRLSYPAVPQLRLGPLIRDTSATHLVIFSQQHILQMDILESAVDTGDPHHILCALPTGFGKTMPMLLLGHLLPPGAGCKISDPFALHNVLSRVHYDDRGPPHPN